MKQNIESFSGWRTRLCFLMFTLLFCASVVFAQGAPAANLSGKYEGTLKRPDENVSLELKSEGGKISARFQRGQTALDTTEGTLEGEELNLSFGVEALLIAKVVGDKIVGNLVVGTEKRFIELKKVMASAATAAPAAADPVNLSGEWDAVADTNGQAFPFILMLKVEGDKVSGTGSSQLGDSTIKSGTWKDGRLALEMEGHSGVIVMTARFVDGKLTGDFDLAGQVQGTWIAVRKN